MRIGDDLCKVDGVVRLQLERPPPRQQLVENGTERIDIGRRRYGGSEYLLRTRVLRRHHLSRTFSSGLSAVVRRNKLCDPKIEKLRHTSELQSPCNLVCRLLLEKKNHLRKKPISLQ